MINRFIQQGIAHTLKESQQFDRSFKERQEKIRKAEEEMKAWSPRLINKRTIR